MKSMILRYPGDPPANAIEMTRSEFLSVYPREPIRVYSEVGVKETPMKPDEIYCDTCNQDPGDYLLVLYDGQKAVCRKCADAAYLPHCSLK